MKKITIPETHPSINTWSGWHWSKFNKEKKRWAEMIGWLAKGHPKFPGKVSVKVITFFGTKHRHDYDNYTPKFIMDPLVEAGIIKDDNSDVVTELSLKFDYDKKNPRTEILITPIDL